MQSLAIKIWALEIIWTLSWHVQTHQNYCRLFRNGLRNMTKSQGLTTTQATMGSKRTINGTKAPTATLKDLKVSLQYQWNQYNISQLVWMFCLISVCLVKAAFSSVHEILANSTSKLKTNIWSSQGQISRPVIAFATVFYILVDELFNNLNNGIWPEPDWGYRKS